MTQCYPLPIAFIHARAVNGHVGVGVVVACDLRECDNRSINEVVGIGIGIGIRV